MTNQTPESVIASTYISPHLPGMIRNLWKDDPSENSVRTALKLAGDLIQELIDLRAAQAKPSSTVDEAANRLAAARMRDRDEAAELGELDSEPGGSWELPKQIGVMKR